MRKIRHGPGRPRLGEDDEATKRLAVEVAESELDAFRNAAKEDDMTLSAWIRLAGRRLLAARRRSKKPNT